MEYLIDRKHGRVNLQHSDVAIKHICGINFGRMKVQKHATDEAIAKDIKNSYSNELVSIEYIFMRYVVHPTGARIVRT